MRLEVNLDEFLRNVDKIDDKIYAFLEDGMNELGLEVAETAKRIVTEYINDRGHSVGVDTGEFVNGIYHEVIKDGLGFRVADTVPYGIYHEFGTEAHFVSFFTRDGELTSLGKWALRNFSNLNNPVLGKNGKPLKKPKRDDRMTKLKEMGGIIVELDEMAPFRTAIAIVDTKKQEILKEVWDKHAKRNDTN